MGLRKAGAWLGIVEEGDVMDPHDDRYPGDAFDGPDEPGDAISGPEGVQIAMVRPQTFLDAATVGEYFRQDLPVIINLCDMEDADAKRIVDFASGLILGRQGDIARLSRRIFLILPANSNLITDQGTRTDEGFFNQA
ncbi:cell division protein SepF [Actinomadura flavalba]|uniref:cell division protein SepF n=1 Tax=Actinomadura flavalba TaxID=1120938 RepID=UPI00037A2CF9|nr:cell division protein SepF [Actinomadura flavalba]